MGNDLNDERKERAASIIAFPGTYIQDGLVSMHNHDFMEDAAFCAAYSRGIEATGKDYKWHWRVHIGLWAGRIASNLQGDFVECGVNAGFMSSSIMHHLDWNNQDRTFYLLDTFSGIDPRFVSDSERADGILEKNEKLRESMFYIDNLDSVRKNFSEWRRVEIIQGAIPETLHRVETDRVAFLHIDLNCALPEVAALDFFWNRLTKGAPVLLDDYAYHGYHHQKAALDKLAGHLGVSIASLPTGQGLLFKS